MCIAGLAEAGSSYKFYVANAGAIRQIEWSGFARGWDVSVRFDREHCELYCVYQRNRDSFGPSALAYYLPPPPVTIHLYGGTASRPRNIIVDPAGSGHSHITTAAARRIVQTCLTGGDTAIAIPRGEGRPAPQAASPRPAGAATARRGSPFVLPLRI